MWGGFMTGTSPQRKRRWKRSHEAADEGSVNLKASDPQEQVHWLQARTEAGSSNDLQEVANFSQTISHGSPAQRDQRLFDEKDVIKQPVEDMSMENWVPENQEQWPRKLAVGVGTGKASINAFKWALTKQASSGETIMLIFVRPKPKAIPTPMGNYLSISQANKDMVAKYMMEIEKQTKEFHYYLQRACDQYKVQADFLLIDSNEPIHEILIQQIINNKITKIVLGESTKAFFGRLKGSTADLVLQGAPEYCAVTIISKHSKVVRTKDVSNRIPLPYVNKILEITNTSSNVEAETLKDSTKITPHEYSSTFFKACDMFDGDSQSIQSDANTSLFEMKESNPGQPSPYSEFRSLPLEQDGLQAEESSPQLVLEAGNAAHAPFASPTFSMQHGLLSALVNARRKAVEEAMDRKEVKILARRELHDMRQRAMNVMARKDLDLSCRHCIKFTLKQIKRLTNNFSTDAVIAEGKYNMVYKGRLHYMKVAVKVLKEKSKEGFQKFHNEVEVLSLLHHPNVLLWLGCCPENQSMVYEYMPNGTLQDHLFLQRGTSPLPWYTRFRIASEIATVLHFLHSRKPDPIVHQAVKPAHIFLDKDYVSKLGGFGTPKGVPMSIGDTIPYMDPEYIHTGIFTPKSDVFAFGILLLQLLTGNEAIGLYKKVKDALNAGNLAKVIDPTAGEWPHSESIELARLGLMCAEISSKDRPALEPYILNVLEKIEKFTVNYLDGYRIRHQESNPMEPVCPPQFICPIMQEIMSNPVIAEDGHTYQYEAIKIWLEDNTTSPMTNLILKHKELLPNHALRSAISEWKEKCGVMNGNTSSSSSSTQSFSFPVLESGRSQFSGSAESMSVSSGSTASSRSFSFPPAQGDQDDDSMVPEQENSLWCLSF